MIKELKTLIAVAEEGTFAAAGNKIGLTQAAVSAQIQRLENELGLVLFDRVGRSAHLNHPGLTVLEQAKDIVERCRQLGMTPQASEGVKLINVGAITSIQRTLLPTVLAQFHQQHTHCRTRILPGVSMALLDQVDSGELDLAVMIKPTFVVHSDLVWEALVAEPFVLIVPRSHDVNDWQTALKRYPFIRYDRTSFGGRQVDKLLQQLPFDLDEKCEVDEIGAIVKLVELGAGVAIVPQTEEHRTWPKSVKALKLGDHNIQREIGLVYKKHSLVDIDINGLIQLIKMSRELL
ncbi:LysR substrate-binding domain-containing protein [Marinomonas polaris]|uniref:LysR substrate-binding domain-containing protein n=1 Tax=Marinomonas polaris TaxID=293552 RepID=UPI003F98FA8A